MKYIYFIVLLSMLVESKAQEFNPDRLGDKQAILDIDYSQDGKYLAITNGKSIQIWSFPEKVQMTEINSNDEKILSLDFSNSVNFLAVSLNNEIHILEGENFALMKKFKVSEDMITKLRLSPDDKLVAASDTKNRIKVWDMNGSELVSLPGHDGTINDLIFTNDKKFLISASSDKSIKVWDLEKKGLYKTLIGHKKAVRSIDLNPKNNLLSSCGNDRNIFIWDISEQSNTYTRRIKNPHTNWATDVLFVSDKYLITLGHDYKIIQQDLSNPQTSKIVSSYKIFNSIEKQPLAISLNPANFQIAVSSLGMGIYLDQYYQLRFKTSHDFQILSINGKEPGEEFTSSVELAEVKILISRPNSIKSIKVINSETKGTKILENIANELLVINLTLQNGNNHFEVVIQDIDPKINDLVYNFRISKN